MNVSLVTTPQVSVLSTFLRKISLLFKPCKSFVIYMLKLFSMIFIFFWDDENVRFRSLTCITPLYFHCIFYCVDIYLSRTEDLQVSKRISDGCQKAYQWLISTLDKVVSFYIIVEGRSHVSYKLHFRNGQGSRQNLVDVDMELCGYDWAVHGRGAFVEG